jgi:hypothetical protein
LDLLTLTLDVVAMGSNVCWLISDGRKVTGTGADAQSETHGTNSPAAIPAQCIELCSRKGQLPLPLGIKLSAIRKMASAEGECRGFP